MSFTVDFKPAKIALVSKEDFVENHYQETSVGKKWVSGLSIDYTMTSDPVRYVTSQGTTAALSNKESFSVSQVAGATPERYVVTVSINDTSASLTFAPGTTYQWCAMSEEYSK